MDLLIHLFLIVGDIVSQLITFSCPTEIYSAKTFDFTVENTSDHLPIMVKLNQSKIPDCAKILKEEYITRSRSKTKILSSKLSYLEKKQQGVTLC